MDYVPSFLIPLVLGCTLYLIILSPVGAQFIICGLIIAGIVYTATNFILSLFSNDSL